MTKQSVLPITYRNRAEYPKEIEHTCHYPLLCYVGFRKSKILNVTSLGIFIKITTPCHCTAQQFNDLS